MSPITFDPTRTSVIDLDDLTKGKMGEITPSVGGFFREGAIASLEDGNHLPGVMMSIDGDCSHEVAVIWDEAGDPAQRQRAWNDPGIAAENGAYGIAVLLVVNLTEHTVAERARKGTGFDYWLGTKGSTGTLFQSKARLEVSGIRRGDARVIAARVNRKVNQIRPSNSTGLPAVIVVVEFGSPRTRVKCT